MRAVITFEFRFLRIGGKLKAHELEKISTPYVIAVTFGRVIG
jgi:hypothetical protein